MSSWYRWEGEDLLLWIRAQLRSSQNGFAEVLGDAIKLRITAPPVDGKANSHIVAWLARQFRVPKSAVTIEQGENSRRKRIRIRGPVQLSPPLADIFPTDKGLLLDR